MVADLGVLRESAQRSVGNARTTMETYSKGHGGHVKGEIGRVEVDW